MNNYWTSQRTFIFISVPLLHSCRAWMTSLYFLGLCVICKTKAWVELCPLKRFTVPVNKTLFGNWISAVDKLRWSHLGCDCVHMKGGNLDTETEMHTGKMPCEHENRIWGDNVYKPRNTKVCRWTTKSQEKAWNRFFLTVLTVTQPCDTLILDF